MEWRQPFYIIITLTYLSSTPMFSIILPHPFFHMIHKSLYMQVISDENYQNQHSTK